MKSKGQEVNPFMSIRVLAIRNGSFYSYQKRMAVLSNRLLLASQRHLISLMEYWHSWQSGNAFTFDNFVEDLPSSNFKVINLPQNK